MRMESGHTPPKSGRVMTIYDIVCNRIRENNVPVITHENDILAHMYITMKTMSNLNVATLHKALAGQCPLFTWNLGK